MKATKRPLTERDRKRVTRLLDELADRAASGIAIRHGRPDDFDVACFRRDLPCWDEVLDYLRVRDDAPFSDVRRTKLLDHLRGQLDPEVWRALVEEFENAVAVNRAAAYIVGAAAGRRAALSTTST